MSKQKIVIRLGVANAKNRSKAMQLASKFVGVNSVAITGEGKDRLEVVGESIDIPCLICLLRRKVCCADIVVVEEVKDKKKEEEEKKKKAIEECKKLWASCPPPCPGGYHPGLPPTFLCEEQPAACHIQ